MPIAWAAAESVPPSINVASIFFHALLKHTLMTDTTILYSIESILSPMSETYGSRLNEALRLRDRSRKELAEVLGISVQAIGQVINGPTVALTAENHEKAVRFLKIDGYWLATGAGSATSAGADWPFQSIDKSKVLALKPADLAAVETSVIIYAERRGIDLSSTDTQSAA